MSTVLTRPPAVVSVAMGYGHLRAAKPLAEILGVPLLRADLPPVCRPEERRVWRLLLSGHSALSHPVPLGSLFGLSETFGMDWITRIPPLYPERDLVRPDVATRLLGVLMQLGLGKGLLEHLLGADLPLVTTFYAPAILADRAGLPHVYCVVTDADVQRVWVAPDPSSSRIHYFAPSFRVVRRLRAYGVHPNRISLTGFPLPPSLLGGPDLTLARRRLAERIVRLDPEGSFRQLHETDLVRIVGDLPRRVDRPLRLCFAVGGAGIQADLADGFLVSLSDWIKQGRLELTLVAGLRSNVAQRFHQSIERAGLDGFVDRGLSVLSSQDFEDYYVRFNQALAQTDLLWTKPSELTFYGALGIPLILTRPVGTHERFNRRWLRRLGVGLKQESPRYARGWLGEWLADGTLAGAAWSGFVRMPKEGTFRIARHLSENGHATLDSDLLGSSVH